MKIVNFGSCNIDYVYDVAHFVKQGKTIASAQMTRFPGGKGLNQAIAAARAGAEIYHAGCTGEDGLFLKELMASVGVNTDFLKVIDTASGHAIIRVEKGGENSIILYGGANKMINRDDIDEVLANFEKGDILMLQNEINNTEYIIDKAYEKGMKILLNPSPFQKSLLDIDLNKLSYLILNEVEACEFSGMAGG